MRLPRFVLALLLCACGGAAGFQPNIHRAVAFSSSAHRATPTPSEAAPTSSSSSSKTPVDEQDLSRMKKSKSRAAAAEIFEVSTVQELDSFFEGEDSERFRTKKNGRGIDYDMRIRSISVKGDTQRIGDPGSPDFVHPVVKELHRRKYEGYSVENNKDENTMTKVALVIEGGGMRGCVSAGMVCAIRHLGLRDCVDVVYGSSAGSVIGAYFITNQLKWLGPELYYDQLTNKVAGKEFIDTKNLINAITGFRWFKLPSRRLRGWLNEQKSRITKVPLKSPPHDPPVLLLPYLLERTVQKTKPLDWETFKARQKFQPLKVVASALREERAYVMDYESGHFNSLETLAQSMHASCLLPGIAGPLMNLNLTSMEQGKPEYVLSNGHGVGRQKDDDLLPLADALIYGPLPYREAIEQSGATHVIMLRTRPDGTDVTGKGGLLERLLMRRMFRRLNRLPNIYQRLRRQEHKRLYGENVLQLNEYSKGEDGPPYVLPIAIPPGSPEVSRLEQDRTAIFEGVRRGFARAYDALVEDPSLRGRGVEVAKEYFPDEILDYDPNDLTTTTTTPTESAFVNYQKRK